MTPENSQKRQQWALLLLTICTFFILLGSRALNEPDEGRYSEIAREMVQSGDWLVPHFWYIPHFDKPPMTYWLVAVSLKLFGQNEWAVRLPLALAGLSGAGAAWFLGKSIGGRRAGLWSVLMLQSSLLYFGMARMLTTVIFLTHFVAWAVYFFWRSWLSLRDASGEKTVKGFWPWHLAGWLAIALGFLTKGPVALVIPLVAILSLVIFRWKTFARKGLLAAGMVVGLALFFAISAPWFLAANARVPHTLDYMVFHQAAGHVLGTAIKSRRGFPLYFFAIIVVGLLPWTWLLGWLWRRKHWRQLADLKKDAWLMLNAWAVFTFTLFSVTHSKLPAYILPMFPAMAVLLAVRYFGERDNGEAGFAPDWAWRVCAGSALGLPMVFPIILKGIFHVNLPPWMNWQAPVLGVMAVGVFVIAGKWNISRRAAITVGLGICSMLVVAEEAPWFETSLKANETLKPLGMALQENCRAGEAVLCWGQLPEGLPFYSGNTISSTNLAYFAGMKSGKVPFEFPGNQDRLGDHFLTSDDALVRLLDGTNRVFVVVQHNAYDVFHKAAANRPLRPVAQSGQWELYCNH